MFRIVLICSHLQEPIFYRAVKSEVSCFTIFVNPSVLESCKNVRIRKNLNACNVMKNRYLQECKNFFILAGVLQIKKYK